LILLGFSPDFWYHFHMKNDALLAENAALKSLVSDLQSQIVLLKEQVDLLTQKLFGKSSEKLKDDEPSPQIPLFDEPEVFADVAVEDEADDEVEVLCVKKKKKKRASLPDTLPRVEVIHDLPEAEKFCPHDGAALKKIGEETSEQLNYIPATLEVLFHRRFTYACPCCDEHLVTAKKPPQPIEKSFATPSLLAHIILSKYADALPLHRQAGMFKRLGVELDTTTLANWMIRCGQLIQPLINLLYDQARAQDVLHLDETVVQVLNEAGRRAEQESRMWVMTVGGLTPTASAQAVVLFRYSETRCASVASDFLGDSQAAIMTDGYAGYNAVATAQKLTHLGCWAHARRYFFEAQKIQPKGTRGKADQALTLIQKLYRIEAEVKEAGPTERFWQRIKHSKPILDQLRQWLDKCLEHPIKQGKFAEAVTYLHNQWPKLIRYIENGAWPIDNNRAENAIRPFVIGRKNWLFSASPKGAEASANLYSLIETAKANGLEPGAYLKELLEKLPLAKSVEDIEALLPWVVKLTSKELEKGK
jgi:transposase